MVINQSLFNDLTQSRGCVGAAFCGKIKPLV